MLKIETTYDEGKSEEYNRCAEPTALGREMVWEKPEGRDHPAGTPLYGLVVILSMLSVSPSCRVTHEFDFMIGSTT